MTRILLCLSLWLNLCLNAAFAQTPPFENLTVEPSPALAQTPLRARSLFQFCRFGEAIGKSSVSRNGQVLTLSINMVPQPGSVCFATPPPPEPVFFDLGGLEPGHYTLIQQPLSPAPNVAYPALQTQFFVAGSDSFSALSVLPNPAFAGQALQARSTFNLCLRRENITSTQVSLSGSVVTLRLQMQAGTDPCDIGVPPPAMPINLPIGSFPPGNYTLVQQPISSNPAIVYPALSTSFSVGQAPVAVPSTSLMGNFALALVIGMGAVFGIYRRRD